MKKTEGGLFFLDSGAHSLYNREVFNKGNRARGYGFYETKEFYAYVDAYAAFVKKYEDVIDYYANVDVIFNPDISWKVLKYLESKHGLHPVPVIHCGTPLKWVERHIEAGYEYLGIGGLGQGITADGFRKWANNLFTMLCPSPSHLPVVRTHGFAMTAYDLLIRYPWWSVDSATWTKVGAFGSIMVPHKRKGQFVFTEAPYVMAVSEDSPAAKKSGKHYAGLSRTEQQIIRDWLEEIQMPLGKTDKDGTIVEYGVINRHAERKIANLLFFEKMRASLPEYPWPFTLGRMRKQHGLGIL